MDVERYKKIVDELVLLFGVGKKVSERLAGTVPALPHHSYADAIFTKLLAHSASLHKLSPQFGEGELWDMPSACAVARCIIEAHDVLEYIALAAVSEQEGAFRRLVWKLHDQQRRSKMLRAMNSTHPEAQAIHARSADLNRTVQNHACFNTLNNSLKKRIVSNDAPAFLLSQREQNQSNGVNHDYHTIATMTLSQHVHTFPMSVHQLFEFKAGAPEALHMSSIPIQYTNGFLARAIGRMVESFPGGAMPLTTQEDAVLTMWRCIVQDGLPRTTV